MANISLKEYLEQVDSLVRDGAFEEVVFHCRQILKHFPKNISAYRSLSAALLGSGQWEAAEEAFMRVLSVIPDDVLAHFGLGQVYQHLGQPDQAIWHLERAYEQDPTNKQFVRDLKSLYFEHRGLDDVRLQLTTGAIVQQYERNHLHEQAITTLITALDDMPDRVDLQLLLARIHQNFGARYDAADIALDVLEMLPDCLEANILVAKMWLREHRPSEAQRFLSRIETVDPYLALELASGQTPDDYLFNLPEVSFHEAARRRITDTEPDWLSVFENVSEEEAAEIARSVSEVPVVRDSDEPAAVERKLSDTDWLAQLSSLDLDEAELPTAKPPSTPAKTKTGLTGLLSTLYPQDQDEAHEDQELMESPESVADSVADTLDLDLVQAGDAGDTQMETVPDEALFESDDEDDDLLGWLAEDDDEDLDEADEKPAARKSAAPTADPSDPLAWMRASGIELADEPQAEIFDPNVIEDDGGELQDLSKVDSIAWLRGSGIEIDTGALSKPVFEVDEQSADDSLGWLDDSDVELQEEEPTPATPAKPTASWLGDDTLLEEMLSMEELTGDDDFLGGSLFDDLKEDSTDESEPGSDLRASLFEDEETDRDLDMAHSADEALFDDEDFAATMMEDEGAFDSAADFEEENESDRTMMSDAGDIVDLLEPPDVDFDYDEDEGFDFDEDADSFSELDDDDINMDDLLR